MKYYAPAVLNNLHDRTSIRVRKLIWAKARNRDTNAVESVGFWNGDDDMAFTIDGSSRTYLGAGTVLGMGDIVQEVGLNVRTIDIDLSGVDGSVNTAFRGYDMWLAPVEIHEAFFDVESHNLLATPNRIFKGWLDGLNVVNGEEGGTSKVTFVVASNSRILTQKLGAKKSNSSHKERHSGDEFYKYADISGAVMWAWGEELVTSPDSK